MKKILQAVSLSLVLLSPLPLTSCADFWHDWRNSDNPPPDTPAVDPVDPDPVPSVVLLTDDQLVNSATQSLILAITRKGLSGTGMYSPQNSIWADRVFRTLISEDIVRYGQDYCLFVTGPSDDGFDVLIAKDRDSDPVIHISKKRRP